MTQGPALCCVTFVLTPTAMQRNARIDSDPIFVFLCVAFLRLITKKSQILNIFVLCKLDATHGPLRHINYSSRFCWMNGNKGNFKDVCTCPTSAHTKH